MPWDFRDTVNQRSDGSQGRDRDSISPFRIRILVLFVSASKILCVDANDCNRKDKLEEAKKPIYYAEREGARARGCHRRSRFGIEAFESHDGLVGSGRGRFEEYYSSEVEFHGQRNLTIINSNVMGPALHSCPVPAKNKGVKGNSLTLAESLGKMSRYRIFYYLTSITYRLKSWM